MTIFANELQKIKKHLAITACHEIADIMLPQLKNHGITVFNFYRMYFDGSVIRLSTDRNWAEHYFQKDYLSKSTIPASYLTKALNFYFWLTEDCPEILLDAALNFNTSNGISIAEKHEGYIEYFCFATTNNNKKIINHFYLNNLELLYQYGMEFKAKAESLLKQFEQDKIYLPQARLLTIPSSDRTLVKLSPQQTACANLLLKGMKYKEIGRELNLSARTVETYLNNLKTKLDCQNRTELIICLTNFLQK